MMRILFLILWIIPLLAPEAHADIEIYVNGHKYPSFEAYRAAEKLVLLKPKPSPVPLKKISDAIQHKLYVLSVENGVVGALRDFYQNGGQSDLQVTRQIVPDQLQAAIAQALATSKGPKLLIATPGKVRIMALTADEEQQ